ncbi:MAG: hypothetical protein QM757_15975 [Paludibaculum sp.]
MLLIVGELCILLVAAHRTQLWYDELLTLHISRTSAGVAGVAGLVRRWDGTPPGHHGLVRIAELLPPGPQVTLRLPSIAGYVDRLCSAHSGSYASGCRARRLWRLS